MNEPIETPPPAESTPVVVKKYTTVDYVFSFITITAGVLIALLIQSFVEWNTDRELVAEARANITREVRDNLKELEGLPEVITKSNADIDNALNLARELLAKGTSDIHSVNLGFNLPTLSATSWRTAQQTGALSHMEYDEAQKYSGLYFRQDMFLTQQNKAIDLVASASMLMAGSFDPTAANTDDVRRFREQLMLLQANLLVTSQLGEQLLKAYREFLQSDSNR
jgi:hypothetical protein